jgi:ABC-type Mn2+/Zn2+ transport system ATPase subunit
MLILPACVPLHFTCLPPHPGRLAGWLRCCRYKLPEQQVADAVETALELVNMKQFMHRATHTLSGGQRQRVAIAGALLCIHAAG